MLKCMAPIYDTARTTPGLTIGGGVAYQHYPEVSARDVPRFNGARGSLSLNYASTNWFSLLARTSLLLNLDRARDELIYPFGALGVKFSTVNEKFNMALRIEAEYPRLITLTPMFGFGSRNQEYLTIGFQTTSYLPWSAHTIIHPFPNWHLFVGVGFASDFFYLGDICVGLGYTWNLPKKEEEVVEDTLDY